MPLSVLLAAAAVAISIPLLWWSVAGARSDGSAVGRDVLLGDRVPDARALALQHAARERTVVPLLRVLAALAGKLTTRGWVERLDRRLTLAGRPPAWPLERILAAKVVMTLVGAGAGFLFAVGDLPGGGPLLGLALTGLGYFTPDLLLISRAQERQEAIGKALPDTLDQMTISVEAGLGFDLALARVARTGSGPLADEFVRTLQEVQLGVSRVKALRNLAERTEQPDLRRFVLALIQADTYGIPLADVLRVQAAEQRTARRQRAEEHAMKIPVKIAFPLIVCIMPTLFIIILGPAAIQISRTLGG